jgi:ABC-type lipoprotein export system ATPase subunit
MDFRSGGRPVTVLDIRLLEIAAGSSTGISGPSGSGKTTLLNIITGILTPTAGAVRVDGVDLASLSAAERDRFRAERIGYVFQAFNLIPPLTALENVLLPMGFASRIAKRERRSRAQELLERVNLGHRLHHKPAELSHGEQQRVGIARALANRPRLIVADEPTASLEPGLTQEIARLLVRVCQEEQATLLVASHDRALLRNLARVEEMQMLNASASGDAT